MSDWSETFKELCLRFHTAKRMKTACFASRQETTQQFERLEAQLQATQLKVKKEIKFALIYPQEVENVVHQGNNQAKHAIVVGRFIHPGKRLFACSC